jgi:predicted MFS family arabinose efflux permease
MTQPGASERRATRLIFLLCGMAHSSWAPLVPYAKARVHANDQQFGLLLLCFGAGSILSMPAMGALANRYGCKRLIQFSGVAIFLGLVAVSVAASSTLLALSLFLFGASIGAIDVVMNMQASLVERHSGENLMSGFHGLFSVGGFAGALVISGLLWLNTPAGWAALIMVFLLSILLLFASPALLPYGDDQQERTKRFIRPGNYVLFLAVLAFIMMLAEGSMLDWSAVFLVDKAGMIQKNAGIGYTAFSIAMTISRFGGNVIIQRIGRRWTITVGALIAAGGFFLVTLLANPAGSIIGFALIGLGAANGAREQYLVCLNARLHRDTDRSRRDRLHCAFQGIWSRLWWSRLPVDPGCSLQLDWCAGPSENSTTKTTGCARQALEIRSKS